MKTTDLQDIISHYQRGEGGRHWFDRDTMRFFRSRLPQKAYTSADGLRSYFVTSEQFVGSQGAAPRKFTVRAYDWETRDIATVGAFNEIRSRSTATARAKALALAEDDEATIDIPCIQDFSASIEDDEATIDIPWATEDGELAYLDSQVTEDDY